MTVIGKLKRLSDPERETLYLFVCPGCKRSHPIRTAGKAPVWSFNGDHDKPTFKPSLLVNKNHPESRCHLFLTDGNIQFLGDCHHELKGQTVPLPEWDDERF